MSDTQPRISTGLVRARRSTGRGLCGVVHKVATDTATYAVCGAGDAETGAAVSPIVKTPASAIRIAAAVMLVDVTQTTPLHRVDARLPMQLGVVDTLGDFIDRHSNHLDRLLTMATCVARVGVLQIGQALVQVVFRTDHVRLDGVRHAGAGEAKASGRDRAGNGQSEFRDLHNLSPSSWMRIARPILRRSCQRSYRGASYWKNGREVVRAWQDCSRSRQSCCGRTECGHVGGAQFDTVFDASMEPGAYCYSLLRS